MARLNFIFFLFFSSLLFNKSYAQQPRLMLPIGHTDGITSAHFRPDGKKVVTISDDRTAKIWDTETGVLLADLKGHISKVNFAVFSPDGKKIVTTSSDFKLNIWNVETGQLDTVLTGHKDEILSARFSPDGRKIITASDDNTVRIWDLKSGKCDTVLTRHTNSVNSAEFSPSCPDDPAGGQRFLTASSDSTALVWDIKTNKLISTIREQVAGLKFAHFSPDGKKILTVSFPKTDNAKTKPGNKINNDPFQKKDTVKIKIWNALTGGLITELKGYTPEIWSAWFSPDGKKVLAASQDQTAKIWNAETGEPDTAYEHDDAVVTARYNQDGTRFVTASGDAARIWGLVSGKSNIDLKGHTGEVRSAEYSFDGKKIITSSADHTAKIWDAGSGKLLVDLKGHTSAVKFARYYPDGKKIITISADSIARIWDVLTGKFIACLNGVNYNSNTVFNSISFSRDGKKILTASYDNSLQLWDSETGKLDSVLTGNESSVNAALFSPDSTKMIIASVDKTPRIKIWDTGSGQFELLRKHTAEVNSVAFSPDGSKMVTASSDSSAIFWSGKTREYIKTLTGHKLKINTAAFSPDGKKMITASLDNYIRIWDAETGKTDTALFVKGSEGVKSAWFSPDGKKFITHNINFITVWNAESREKIAELPVNKNAQFSFARSSPDPNGKKIVTISDDNMVRLWDTDTGKPDNILAGHENTVNSAEFSPDGKNIITASDDNMVKIWDAQTGRILYTFFAVDSIDYLVIDKDNHYDGTDAAIKLLNFIRGTEIISLAQVKGPLWIPDLAERLNTGDIIKERSLEDLDAFGGAIPQIEINQEGEKEYRFSIQPGRGGLGEIILFVNDIEARKFNKEQLSYHDSVYDLRVNRDSLNKYFVSDEDNWISLKAKTKDNSLSSEEAKISFNKDEIHTGIHPNLYAVMVGTSQYKELPKKEESIWGPANINLKYPAVDAHAVSQTVERAAKNKLNTDGKNHVFMYNLTTDSADILKPNKQTIKLILDSIGRLATANDILLIFLSGHGVVSEDPGSKKQFYYMTADAASLTDETTYREVGISTDTLLDWIKLENIAANKRILILDACYSGQVINDLKKDIDRLKENSKMFILSASASNQSAFESETYSHGHLAYSLLKAIKQQPDILEDGKKLNISRWFNAAGKLVSAIAEEENNAQKTHIFTVVDFDIGVVDPPLIKNIRLKQTKPLFISSNFQNADKLDDDSGFSNSVNTALKEIYEGPESKIKYEDASAYADAYKISGRYAVKGNNVEVKFIVKKGNDTIKIFNTPVKGTINKLYDLAKNVAKLAADWVGKIIEPL